jgi:hypothetical protein
MLDGRMGIAAQFSETTVQGGLARRQHGVPESLPQSFPQDFFRSLAVEPLKLLQLLPDRKDDINW